MLPINTMQPVVRDTIPPTFSNDAMVSAEVKYGTNIFISGLKALDEGRDISRDIKYSFDELPNTFIEGGSISTLFYVYDKGGNYIEQEVEVPITGSPKHKTPVLYDFTQLTELPAAFTQTNGEWAVTENGLMSVGIMPPSPRWNISLDTDADADFQIQFIPVTAGLVHGVTFRGSNLDDMFYCFYRDGVFTLWERFEGVPQEVTFVTDDTLNESSLISLGVSCVGDTLTIYNGADPIITHQSEQLRFSRQFGIISTSDQAFYQKIMVGQAGALTFGEYEMANEPPIANAGPDQSVVAGSLVQLDGSASYDPDPNGSISGYGWVQTSGDSVDLDSDTIEKPKFIAPSKADPQALKFDLVVVDNEGSTSEISSTTVNVAAVEQSDVLNILDKLHFTLDNDGVVTAYPGRSNRETFRFKPSRTENLVLDDDGYLNLEQNDIDRIEISVETRTGILTLSSKTAAINLEGSKAHCRLGDLQLDSSTKSFDLTFTVYVDGDEKGVVMIAPTQNGNASVKYYQSTIKTL